MHQLMAGQLIPFSGGTPRGRCRERAEGFYISSGGVVSFCKTCTLQHILEASVAVSLFANRFSRNSILQQSCSMRLPALDSGMDPMMACGCGSSLQCCLLGLAVPGFLPLCSAGKLLWRVKGFLAFEGPWYPCAPSAIAS